MFDMFIMNMGGHDENLNILQESYPHAKVIRYYNNHLDTIKRCLPRARTSYIWVIASCCDYSDFDFDYQAAPWEGDQIHCWASGEQQYGETFLIPVNEFNKQLNNVGDILEWYKDINWHTDGVPRLSWPVLKLDIDPVKDIMEFENNAPYFWINQEAKLDLNLWRKPWYFHKLTQTGSVSLAPREIRGYLDAHIYDYPWIKNTKAGDIEEKSMDIIHISNNEPQADEWYNQLCDIVPNKTVKRITGVNGRAEALKAAARLSDTPWFFAVPAKLEVLPDFDFSWDPDILHLEEEPKHYIFHAMNPVNGLEYGHMGIVAYNKKLVLETEEYGLDFTLSKPHMVNTEISGIAHYNATPHMTWRTAFRETIKLKDDVERNDSLESEHRLNTWLTVAEGDNAEWSLRGAEDAMQYYNDTGSDYKKLMFSFDWSWLKEYYDLKYSI
jgi:hypothetical protein